MDFFSARPHRFIAALAVAAGLLGASLSPLSAGITRETFTAAPGSRLVIDIGYGDVEVTTTTGRTMEIAVERHIAGRSDSQERKLLEADALTITQRADVVTIRSEHVSGRAPVLGILRGRKLDRTYTYRLEVPEELIADIQTREGSIAVSGLSGRLRVQSVAGGVSLEQVQGTIEGRINGGGLVMNHCQGTVSLRTNGGSIRSRGSNGTFQLEASGGAIEIEGHDGALELRTNGGGIVAAGIDGTLDAKASGGSVRVSLAGQPTDDCRLATSGGSIALSLAPEAAVEIDASTRGGAVRSDVPVASTDDGRNDVLRGTINGGGPRLELRATGGSIHLQAH